MLRLDDCFRHYHVEHCKVNRVPTQRTLYAQKALETFFGADKDVESLKRADFRAYRIHRSESGISDATIRRELGAMAAAMRHNAKEERIVGVPCIDMPDDSPPLEQWLTEAQLVKILEEPTDPATRLFLFIAVATAARAAAIEELTWDRVDLVRGTIDFRVPGARVTRKRRAIVPISDMLLPVLREAHAKRNPEEPLVLGGKFNTYRNVKSLLKRAGIEGIRQPRHIFRKTYASLAIQSGHATLEEVSRVLADTMATVEKRYAHFHPSHLKGAVNFRSQPA